MAKHGKHLGSVDLLGLNAFGQNPGLNPIYGTLIDVLNGHDLDYGWRPCQLTWRAPFLQVTGVERQGCRVHLAAAMLAHLGASLPNPTGRSAAAVLEGCH